MRTKASVVCMVVGMVVAPLAAHGSMHSGSGTSWVSVETAHVFMAVPGLPWALGLLMVISRGLPSAARAGLGVAAAGGGLMFVAGIAGSRPQLHDQWESGPLAGSLLLSLGLLIAAISLRHRLPRWVVVVASFPVPGLVLGNILGNVLVDRGGRIAGETAFYASLSFGLVGLAACLDRSLASRS